MANQPFPEPIPFTKMLGPSFIILALGFGSGEVILWPYLASNFGLGIAWGALVGITFQYFINMEISRYALIKGESVFVGLHKRWPLAPYWFIISTFIGFGLPGIIAASAETLSVVFGLQSFKWLGIGLLLLVGIVLSSSKAIYDIMERMTKTLIFVGLPFIIILAFYLVDAADLAALGRGFIGRGDGYSWLPEGINLATFLAAFAYSGAGGNLNLTQSMYVREKGYGMGVYAQKIAGLFTTLRQHQHIRLHGHAFDLTPQNIHRFRGWWKKTSWEHGIVFWLFGLIGISMLMLLSYVTTYGSPNNTEGISFVINQGITIGQQLSPIIGTLFLLVISTMLFQTQFGILDSSSRIMAENFALQKSNAKDESTVNLSHVYFIFLWAQIAFGIILFLLNIYEPRTLIVLGAVLNAVAMFVHIGLVNWMNYKTLPAQLQPGILRKMLLLVIFGFFGFFSTTIIFNTLFR